MILFTESQYRNRFNAENQEDIADYIKRFLIENVVLFAFSQARFDNYTRYFLELSRSTRLCNSGE
jgi:hypothetical protein